jgi:trimethylamine--corrinoid protein Co-methyltransferase
MVLERFDVLNEKEISRVHDGVCKVLGTVGARIPHSRILHRLQDARCDVDFQHSIVRFPEVILQDTLSGLPSTVMLCGQKPEYDIELELGKKTYLVGASAARFICDTNNEHRLAMLQDLADTTRFYDYLDNCHIMQQAVIPSDIAEEKHDRISFATLMANSPKHNWTWPEDTDSIEDHSLMASLITGNERIHERPIFSEGLCLMCPLQMSECVCEMLVKTSEKGIPLFIEVDPMMGATSPVTIAGTLVLQTATILSGIVIAQLINRGVPCIYVLASGLMNMRHGNFIGATPEITLLYMGATQIAHHYGVPIVVGSSIDAIFTDVQAGYEKALQLLPLLLAKPDIIHLSIGMLEQMMLVSYAQGLIDNEIVNASLRLQRGINVTEEALALETIGEIGHRGNFLAHPHTLDLFKQELWMPELGIRCKRETWEKGSRKTVKHIANERAKEILDSHHPKPLSESTEKELMMMALNLHERANS